MSLCRTGPSLAFCLVLAACGPKAAEPAKAPPRASAAPVLLAEPAPKEPPLAELRTGAMPPNPPGDVDVSIVGRSVKGDVETLKLTLGDAVFQDLPASHVNVKGALMAFVTSRENGRALWVRRARSRASEPIEGSLFLPADRVPGQELRLHQKGTAPSKPSPGLESESFTALAATFSWFEVSSNPFAAFASRRLRELAEPKGKKTKARKVLGPGSPPGGSGELARLMDASTGRSAVQRALMADRKLSTDAREKRSVPLASVRPPSLPRADYKAMLAALGRVAPDEPLAHAVPADFWYFRSRTFAAFLDVLDLADDWGQPAANALDERSSERGTTARYQAELGLERTELSRVLGPSAIESVAVVGSDPYVHEGTDITLLFKVKAPPLFEAALAKALGGHAAAHGGVTASTSVHEGIDIRSSRSPDGRVRQERATVAGVELVSNSPAAIRRVISAALGKAPRLSDEPDLAFLLARDAGKPDESFGFLGDRFVLTTVGPKQKIAEARRALALGELTAPGVGSLLYGWLNGQTATGTKQLVDSGVLTKDELVHFDRAPIEWAPGKAPRSRWGALDALEPLIDLPPVDMVTKMESEAYAQFAMQYTSLWTEYVDPVALRIARSTDHPGRFEIALRALPLLMRENREMMRIVGSAHVDAPEQDSGLRFTLALGKEADLRRELTRAASFGGHSFKFDWLGDSIVLGLADRNEVTHVTRSFVQRRLEPPDPEERPSDEIASLLGLPAYAIVAVRNRMGAALAIAALKKLTSDAAPEMFQWRAAGKHRDVQVVELGMAGSGFLPEGASLSYALCPNALIFSLSRPVLDQLIDEQLDGKAPRNVPEKRAGDHGQLLVELGTEKDGAFSTALGWLVTAALLEQSGSSRLAAEAVLRGAPEARSGDDAFRRIARATLGSVPLTPDGAVYRLTGEGLTDPARGSAYAPIFPKTPVAGSPLSDVLSRFERLRSEVSFDSEPGSGITRGADPRSFSAKVTLDLRPAGGK